MESYMTILSEVVGQCIHCVAMNHVSGTLYWMPSPSINEGNVFDILDEVSSTDHHLATQLCNNISQDGWDTQVLSKPKLTIRSNNSKASYVKDFNVPPQDLIWSIVSDKNYITLRQLVEGVYRMKLSKYEFIYEMFCNLDLTHEDEEGYTIYADFDHGS